MHLKVSLPLRTLRSLALALGGGLLSAAASQAADGTFSTLTYNVAGLPQIVSSAAGDRAAATRLISCYIKQFDVVNVQEDFSYHADLYDSCDDHPYRSPTSGSAGIGSGLNTLSRFPYADWSRVRWTDCNGIDCLTPKGFTLARMWLAEGVFVDIYNLHAQAQTADADLAARRKNIEQLLSYIENESAGNAVIVMGDTNTRYTRSGDNIQMFARHGFADVWVQRERNGSPPAAGAAALLCEPAVTSVNCEIVDKVLYRSGANLSLSPSAYAVRTDALDAAGVELSDHRPVATTWSWKTSADRRLSDAFGGPHGTNFNDASSLPDRPAVRRLAIRSGSRVDRIETVLTQSQPFGHGGMGGNEQSLTLADGEYVTSASLCTGKYNDHTRVFSIEFRTSANRSLSGGTTTSECATYSAPSGWAIVGFHGRSGDEVDKLGMVYAPALVNTAGAAAKRLVNAQSGLCLDVVGTNAADGTNVVAKTCSGSNGQLWSHDASTGLVRSKLDMHYCLDNTGVYDNGANIALRMCSGNANQRFSFDASSGRLRVQTYQTQTVGAAGSQSGANVQTYQYSGASNQLWQLVP